MKKTDRHPYFYGVGSLLLVVFFIYHGFNFSKSFPEYSDLTFLEGELSDVRFVSRTRHIPSSLRFSISSNDIEFVYSSTSGAINSVRDLMETGRIGKVGYDQKDSGRKTVYDLEIDGRKIRSF